jgi:hypothetical protein
LKAILNAPEIGEQFRAHVTDFTRERVLTFSVGVILILRGHKLSIPNPLNKFFQAVGRLFEVVTNSAYSQARQKLKPEVFIHLNQATWREFYQVYGADGQVFV